MTKTKSSETNMKSSNLVALLLLAVGSIIGALTIVAITESQITPYVRILLITMLVLLAFMGCVSIVNCFINKSCKDNYEVNKDAEKGKENTAFDHADDSKKNGVESQPSQQQNGTTALETDTGDEKWGSNYVPFGDYPAKGNIVYVKEYVPQDLVNDMNGVEVINEEPVDYITNQINKTYYN